MDLSLTMNLALDLWQHNELIYGIWLDVIWQIGIENAAQIWKMKVHEKDPRK